MTSRFGAYGVVFALIGAMVATPSFARALCRNECDGLIVCRYPLSKVQKAQGIGAILFQRGGFGLFHERNRSGSGTLHASENDREAGENVTLRVCAERFGADGSGSEFECFPDEIIEYQGFFPCGGPPEDSCVHNPQEPECRQ